MDSGPNPKGSPQEPLLELLPAHRGQHSRIKRAALLFGAGVFFVLGLVGWLVPVVTGVPFYVLSLFLAGMAVPAIARRINHAEERMVHKHRVQLRRFLSRIPGSGH